MKKIISILLVMTLLVISFTGCMPSGDASEEAKEERKPTAQEENNNNTVNDEKTTDSSTVDDSKEESSTSKEKDFTNDHYILTEKEPSVSINGAVIKLSPFDIEDERSIEIKAIEDPPLNFDEPITEEYHYNVYDFTLSDQEDLMDLIEIRLAYNPSFIDPEANEADCAFGLYYNPETEKWENVDYVVDTQAKEVIITTDHLSTFGVFTVKNEHTRLAYIARVNPYKKLVDSQLANEIISEAINRPKSQSQKAIELGMGITNDWLGLSGFLLTTSSPIYTTEFLEGFGTMFNGLGIAAATVQVAVDFQSGNQEALYGNLSKNILNILVSNWGTSALQLSFAGVFAIDYSLNKFATAAWDGRKEIWYDAYNLHYKEKMKLTPRQWYSKFYWIWQDSLKKQDPNYLKDQIRMAMDENITAFFNNESEMAFYQGEVMSNGATGGGGLNDNLIREITDVKRAELAKALQPVFNQLEKKITYYLRDEYRKKLNDMKNRMNQVIQVTIEEIVTEGAQAEYANYIIKFAPLNEKANEKTWAGRLNSDGRALTKFTLLGHLQSGQPNTLEIYEPDADLTVDEPVKVIPFKISGETLTITFGEAPPLESLVGPWPGNFFFKQVTVPDPESFENTSDAETPEGCDDFDIDMASILQGIKEQEGQTQPAIISIAQTGTYDGYMFFGEDASELEESEKLYFRYLNGVIDLSKSEDGFNLGLSLRAEYMDESGIRLYGPIKITGMNNTLDIDIIFEGKR